MVIYSCTTLMCKYLVKIYNIFVDYNLYVFYNETAVVHYIIYVYGRPPTCLCIYLIYTHTCIITTREHLLLVKWILQCAYELFNSPLALNITRFCYVCGYGYRQLINLDRSTLFGAANEGCSTCRLYFIEFHILNKLCPMNLVMLGCFIRSAILCAYRC